MSGCCCTDHPHRYYARHIGDEHWRECVHCGDQTEPEGWTYLRQCPTDDCAGCDSCEDES